MWEMALEDRPRTLRKCNIKSKVDIRRCRPMEMGDYDVEDIVNGEFTRLGVFLLNLRIKDGMVQKGGSRRRERKLLEARLSMWSRVRVLQGRCVPSL